MVDLKRTFVFWFLCLVGCTAFYGQSVGIGTTKSDSSALLDLWSTSKGLLLPRMTNTQRNAIFQAANGLLIYNTTTHQINQRQNGVWKTLLNSDYWVGGGSGQMFNIGDNVGINVAGPVEKLEVGGNIRSTSGLIVDHPSAILQFKSTGINTGFVQLSGDNLRLGTNSGNTDGKIIFRFNGVDRWSIDSNGNLATFINYPPLKDEGNILINKKISRPGAPDENFLPIAHGTSSADASSAIWVSPLPGTTITHVATGHYKINFGFARISPRSSIIVTAQSISPKICTAKYIKPSEFDVFIFDLDGVRVDGDFAFIVNDPNNLF